MVGIFVAVRKSPLGMCGLRNG